MVVSCGTEPAYSSLSTDVDADLDRERKKGPQLVIEVIVDVVHGFDRLMPPAAPASGSH
jgi:hypothetical protein